MLQRSPILRFALEVFEHALELFLSAKPRDRKLAVLNLAQSAELAVKAALIERNASIYQKDGKTINAHEALKQLASAWQLERIELQSRLELLIDERNAIQHRYGDVDDVTLDYHVETVFRTIEGVLRSEFDTELSDWIRDNIAEDVWRRVRFVKVPEEPAPPPSQASLKDRSAALDLIDGFSRYEGGIREIVRSSGEEAFRPASTLDLAIKILASTEDPPQDLIRQLPGVYRLRNQVVHGEGSATDEEVDEALSKLDAVLISLKTGPADLLKRALATVRLGIRGARVLSWDEIGALREEQAAEQRAAEKVVPPANEDEGGSA